MSIGKYRLLLLLLLRKRILILPYYFNILFASNADNTVNTIPNIATSHIVAFWVSENKGSVIPMTNPAKESLDKSKKYPASLSRLVLSFSFRSCFTACCSLASPNNAATAIFAFGSYSKGFVSDAGSNFYCDYTDGTKGVAFGRKTTNGSFFIKNNRSTETYIVLKRIGTL